MTFTNGKDVNGIKEYLITNKPASITFFRIERYGCAIATPYNAYEGGYIGFLYFDYFTNSSNIKFYSLQKGKWVS